MEMKQKSPKQLPDQVAKLNGTKLSSSNSNTSAGGPTAENKSKRITKDF